MFLIAFVLSFITIIESPATVVSNKLVSDTTFVNVAPGANSTELYFQYLKNKRIGLIVNHTSTIGNKHLVDSLIDAGFNIKTIFAPEHGFRGKEDAGTEIDDLRDSKTGIKIISIYGKKLKPAKEDLDSLDVLIFDIQDVGARFYTYISTLHYIMEACAENNKFLIILDRPNPNGHYVDGPILQPGFSSFVGKDKLPIVYGLTMGELAKMINGEKWLKYEFQCNLEVIPCTNYDHTSRYHLPISPSPNLPTMRAIYLYPSLCLFEGTIVSVGRGTSTPFEIFGFPGFLVGSYKFTPKPTPGAMNPFQNGIECTGFNLSSIPVDTLANQNQLNLSYLLNTYNAYRKEDFFLPNLFFDKLAGTDQLRKQILAGLSEREIRSSWTIELQDFKLKRKKYLLYKDFE